MKLLELFSGTHSVGKVCKKLNIDVVSLDKDLPATYKDYTSTNHIQEDILTWNYKIYPSGYFDIITSSPVCLWWSILRNTWIGRKMKSHGENVITPEIIQEDIDNFGKPMVDKVFEILDYFKPKYWWVENPNTSKMVNYIKDKPFYVVDYCKYCDWGYQKRTRFWTNIQGFTPKLCKKDCDNIIKIKTQKGKKSINQYLHKERMGTSKTVKDENGKIIRVNTKKLREEHKDKANLQQKGNLHKVSLGSWGKPGTTQTGLGCGGNRLERYRIPPNLIEELLVICNNKSKIWNYKSNIDDKLAEKVKKDNDIVMTNPEMAKHIINRIKWEENEKVLECCKGNGAFYDNLPTKVDKKWCEINQGRDFFNCNEIFDTIISNPPFVPRKLFWDFQVKSMEIATKRIFWLINMGSLNVFTPRRIKEINNKSWYFYNFHIVSDKRWFGRYVVIEMGRDIRKNIMSYCYKGF